MTPRQRVYLQAVHSESSRLGYPPSLREVAAVVGTAVQTTTDVMTSLERQGLVQRDYATARSLRITDAGKQALGEQAA